MKTFLLFFSSFIFTFGSGNLDMLQYLKIDVAHQYENKKQKITLQREKDPKCLTFGINHKSAFSANMASEDVPQECKKDFVTSYGSIQPISIKGSKTVGELDVLSHIVKSQKSPHKYVLIDSRKAEWFESLTIPSAVNVPYTDIIYDEEFPEDFERLLKVFNIKKSSNGFDFSDAKEAIIFCNGIWCVQSIKAIDLLGFMGYPREKLMWYRGGIQSWLSLNLTTIRGDLKNFPKE